MSKSPTREEVLAAFDRCADIHEVAEFFRVKWSVVRCWLRWLNIDFKPPMEILLHHCLTKTDKEIASMFKVSDKSVTKWKKEYGISKHAIKAKAVPADLTEEQHDVVVGKLLGDGNIERVRTENRSKNTCLRIEQCLLHKEYVQWLHQCFSPFSLAIKERTRPNPFKSQPHHLDNIKSCLFRTMAHPIFTALRDKWYPDDIKFVPVDLQLNWRSIAIWYCDDGSNLLGQRCVRRHGVLCTNSFTENEVEFLIAQLNDKGTKCSIYFDDGKPMIHLHKDTFMFFLSQIEQYVIWPCMQYKLKKNAR